MEDDEDQKKSTHVRLQEIADTFSWTITARQCSPSRSVTTMVATCFCAAMRMARSPARSLVAT